MKQISGYVLVKGSGAGIANLLVSAHDQRDEVDRATVVRKPDALMQSLGRRLGSVLTDANGRFALTDDDLQFQGNEARPNLLLTVSAPEDVQGVGNPTPLSPERRLLYISTVPRRAAGAEEAFLIRLLPGQVKKFNLSELPMPSKDTEASSRVVDTMKSGWDNSEMLRAQLQGRLKTQVDAAQKRREKAKKAIKNLSGIPPHLRGAKNPLYNNTLLIPDRESLTQLPTVQQTALSQGLTRLQNRSTPGTVKLYLTRDQIDGLKLTVDKNGDITGEASASDVAAQIRASVTGFDLIRTRGSATVSVNELQRRYLTAVPLVPMQEPLP